MRFNRNHPQRSLYYAPHGANKLPPTPPLTLTCMTFPNVWLTLHRCGRLVCARMCCVRLTSGVRVGAYADWMNQLEHKTLEHFRIIQQGQESQIVSHSQAHPATRYVYRCVPVFSFGSRKYVLQKPWITLSELNLSHNLGYWLILHSLVRASCFTSHLTPALLWYSPSLHLSLVFRPPMFI